MKQTFLSILLMLLPMMASADAVEIGGIWYNLVPKAKEAEVTKNPNKYSGDVVIPPSVTYNGEPYIVTSIANYAFYSCYNLTSITIPNSVTSIEIYAFKWCSGLTSITIPNSVTSIGNDAFSGCSGLTSVIIPNSVTSIGDYTFSGCSGLTSITIPNSVTTIGESAFAGCSELTSVTISNKVTKIEAVFEGCSRLTSVTIPNSVTSIGGSAFSNCSSLVSVTIPNSVTSIGGSAFYNCSSLASVTIPNSVTSIGGSAFSNCSSLASVTIPNSVTSIGGSAFSNCSSLTSVTIPSSVESIGVSAFSGCTSLTSITIPNSVTYIGEQAFANCDEMTDVYCQAEKLKNERWSGEGLYTYPDAFKDSYPQYMTLHVPAASIEAYRSTEPWSQFNAFVALEDGDTPTIQKCATPEISYANGKLTFTCETEGAEFVTSISDTDIKTHYGSEITLSQKYTVSVYATKAGYENSDVATREIVIENGQSSLFGDLNKDGKVNVADHVELSKIILNQQENE